MSDPVSLWLVRFGIAGVQTFIGQAHKVRDLTSGSALVTWTMRDLLAAARSAPGGPRRILPVDPDAVAHQLTLELDGTRDDVAAVGRFLNEAFERSWLSRLGVADAAAGRAPSSEAVRVFSPFWVATQVEAGGFQSALSRLSKLYDQRKRTRVEAQNDFSAGRSACFLCATRDAVPYRLGRPKEDQLCTVCRAKRRLDWSGERAMAPVWSTRELAASRYLSDSRRGGLALEGIREVLRDGGIEPRDLGVPRIESILLDEDLALEDVAPAVVDRLEKLRRRASAETRNENYYAVCVFDGDSIGKWFAAEESAVDAAECRQHVTKLGEAVTRFARAFRRMELPAHAVRVYAGGDDGLVLLPFDGALGVVTAIHRLFITEMATIGARYPTLSLSLTIAHASHPLQDVLARARTSLEHYAKQQLARHEDGREVKNALALSLVTGTGAHEVGGASWDMAGPGLVEWIETCLKLLSDPGRMSTRFFFELLEELDVCFRVYGGSHELAGDTGEEMLRWIVARLWSRHAAHADTAQPAVWLGLRSLAMMRPSQDFDPRSNLRALLKILTFLQRKGV